MYNRYLAQSSHQSLTISLLLLSVTLLLMTACSSSPVTDRNYYIIDYAPIPTNPNLVLSRPLPYKVEVPNTRIGRIYDRSQLVFRYSQHRVEYANNDLWAVRLSGAIPDAITNHLVRYNTFAAAQRDFLVERPHYEIITTVNQIEMLHSDFYFGAHINMDIFLRQADDLEYVARHSFSRETELFTENVEVFVQQVSKIIKEEVDIFIEKVLLHFEVLDASLVTEKVVPIDVEEAEETEELPDKVTAPTDRQFGLTQEQLDTWLAPSPREQLMRESKRDLVGMGRVFVPAMSSSEAEPFYTLYSSTDYANFFEKPGGSLYLKPGDYILHYGSGSENQKMTKELTVVRDFTHVIEPDWGGLRIRVIDENRSSIDSQFELFSVVNAESYGYGQGVLEEFGEPVQTWILHPGTYKIVLNNFPFNTLEDFVTIDVVLGELRTITLVVDSETKKLKGAGILGGLEAGRDAKDWRFSSTMHGNFNLNWDNSVDRDNPNIISVVNTQLDSRLNLDKYPYYYTAHNLTDLGISKAKNQDFRISADSFKLRNTFVYYLSRVIGVYSRLDMETHFFEENIYPADNKNYRLEDSDGVWIKDLLDRDKLTVKPPLFPLIFREGAGLNLRPLNRPQFSLNLRFGFGMRQDIYHDVYRFERVVTDTLQNITYDVYREIDSSFREGLEVSVLSTVRLPLNISYNTTADILVPFDQTESFSYNWENIFTIRMIRQMAIDYKINVAYNKDIRDYPAIVHNVFLRLTYFLY